MDSGSVKPLKRRPKDKDSLIIKILRLSEIMCNGNITILNFKNFTFIIRKR